MSTLTEITELWPAAWRADPQPDPAGFPGRVRGQRLGRDADS